MAELQMRFSSAAERGSVVWTYFCEQVAGAAAARKAFRPRSSDPLKWWKSGAIMNQDHSSKASHCGSISSVSEKSVQDWRNYVKTSEVTN